MARFTPKLSKCAVRPHPFCLLCDSLDEISVMDDWQPPRGDLKRELAQLDELIELGMGLDL